MVYTIHCITCYIAKSAIYNINVIQHKALCCIAKVLNSMLNSTSRDARCSGRSRNRPGATGIRVRLGLVTFSLESQAGLANPWLNRLGK